MFNILIMILMIISIVMTMLIAVLSSCCNVKLSIYYIFDFAFKKGTVIHFVKLDDSNHNNKLHDHLKNTRNGGKEDNNKDFNYHCDGCLNEPKKEWECNSKTCLVFLVHVSKFEWMICCILHKVQSISNVWFHIEVHHD